MVATSPPGKLRLADLLGGLSIVADMGFGLPPGSAMRSCLVATAMARKLGMPDSEITDTFYTALLMHIGCVSMSHETSVLFGNELALTRAVAMTDLADPDDFVTTLIPEATKGLDEPARAHFHESILTHGSTFGLLYDTASGEVARATARRIGLPESTQHALYQEPESWNGDGAPQGLKGEEIARSSRVVRVASDAAFFDDVGNIDIAIGALKKRAGGTLDPDLVDSFVADAAALLAEANVGDPRDRILEVEPEPVIECDRVHLVDVARAFGDVADLKTPFMHNHATKVAALTAPAAERVGLDGPTVETLTIAALLHDLGRVGVSDVVWEKPGPLTTADWELVRMHAYHSERILAISRALEPVARIAGMHHERLDGSGYHRGSARSEIPMSVRVLSAADAFVAMTSNRAHRRALSPERAAEELTAEAREGKLDPEAVDAVLTAAGHATHRRGDKTRPAGLSEREVEVLRLVAEGCSNPEIAERLTVSRRTAEHHVQHIYVKIGVSTRPAAALFALRHDLLR